jgi:hypothetical protein
MDDSTFGRTFGRAQPQSSRRTYRGQRTQQEAGVVENSPEWKTPCGMANAAAFSLEQLPMRQHGSLHPRMAGESHERRRLPHSLPTEESDTCCYGEWFRCGKEMDSLSALTRLLEARSGTQKGLQSCQTHFGKGVPEGGDDPD